MRSFFHEYFAYTHRYPIKVWSAAVINDVPYLISFDGATLRQINLISKKVENSLDYHHLNAFSLCIYIQTDILRYENLFLFVKNQRSIEVYNASLKHIHQFDYDTGSAIIAAYWHKKTSRLFLCGTNGWLRCFHISAGYNVNEFEVKWKLLWEVRTVTDWISSLAHDEFSQLLYGIVEDSLYVWDFNTGAFKYRLPQMHDGFKLVNVDVDQESSVVITSGLDGFIRTWDIKEFECKNFNSIEVAPKGYTSFVKVGRQIVSLGCDRVIKCYGISDSAFRCSHSFVDPSKKVNPDEIIKPQLVILQSQVGLICITSYKEQIQSALLGFVPEVFLTTDSKIIQMEYDNVDKKLLCMCQNNFVLVQGNKGFTSTLDMDIPNSNKSKRCCASEVNCFCMEKDYLYVGFKTGSVKVINIRNKDCYLLDDVPLDDKIDYILTVNGLFIFNHPSCTEIISDKTDQNHPFIVAYTDKGILNVWCAKCYSHLLNYDIGKKPVTCIKIIPEKSLLMISAQKTLTFFRIDAYDFNPVGEITSSGNQTISTFSITEENELVVGTSSGEIMILQMDEYPTELHFTLKHHISFHSPVFKIYYPKQIGKPVVSLLDGTVFGINQKTSKTISLSSHSDAEHLTASFFHYNDQEGTKINAYLAFGSHVHHCIIDMYEEPINEKVEEEEEEEEVKEKEEEDNDEKENNIIQYYEESQANINRLMVLVQKEKIKKKRAQYIPETGVAETPKTPVIPPKKKKATYAEVMAKNRIAIQNALGDYTGSYYFNKNNQIGKGQRFNPDDDFNNDELNLTLEPFFYTDLPANSKIMIPKHQNVISRQVQNSTPRRVEVNEKNLRYNNKSKKFQAVIDKNTNIERTTPMYIPPGGRFVFPKAQHEPVKAPIVIKKIFFAPPSAPRVLFNDPSTLNGLNFFDPRGFRSSLVGDEESYSVTESSRTYMTDDSLSALTEEEELSESIKSQSSRPRTELEKRRLRRNNRIPISLQQRPDVKIRPKTSAQAQRTSKRPHSNNISKTPNFKNQHQNRIISENNSIESVKLQENAIQKNKKGTTLTNDKKGFSKTQNINNPNNLNSNKQLSSTIPIKSSGSLNKIPNATTDNNIIYYTKKDQNENPPYHKQSQSTRPSIIITNANTPGPNDQALESNQRSRPQSELKHVQFAQKHSQQVSSTNPTSSKDSSNSSVTEQPEYIIEKPDSDSHIIDLTMRGRRANQRTLKRKKKVINQPIELPNKSLLTSEYKVQPSPEPEQPIKLKEEPITLHIPKTENESIKAAMSSPQAGPVINKPPPKKMNSPSPTRTIKKKARRKKRSNSGASDSSSAIGADGDQSNLQQQTPELPKTSTIRTLTPEELRDEEQARINRERIRKLTEESLLDQFFQGSNARRRRKTSLNLGKTKPSFPELENLEKYWKQNMIFPVLPFSFKGSPSSVDPIGQIMLEDAIKKIKPFDPQHQFSGFSNDQGVDELVERFQKFYAFNTGAADEKSLRNVFLKKSLLEQPEQKADEQNEQKNKQKIPKKGE